MPDWARRHLAHLKENLHLGRSSPESSSQLEATRPSSPALGTVSPPVNPGLQSNRQPLDQPQIISTPSDSPQRLEIRGCWKEAFEKLQEEHEDLLHVYEKLLLTNVDSKKTQAGPADTSDSLSRLQSLVQDRLDELEKSKFKIKVAGKEIVIREQVGRAINAVLSVKDLISAAEPHSAVAWAGAFLILNPIAKALTRDEDAMTAFEEVTIMLVRYRLIEHTNFEIYSQGAGGFQTPPQELRASIRSLTVKLYTQILGFQISLAHHISKSGVFRFIDDFVVSDDWSALLQAIMATDRRIKDHLNHLSQDTMHKIYLKVDEMQAEFLDVLSQTLDEVKENNQIHLLNELPVAKGAAFNSYEDESKSPCLKGTQTNTLKRIQEWYESPEDQSVYWLKGMAGTGKSTISRTVAEACDKRQALVDAATGTSSFPDRICLAGSFFFDQGKADRGDASKLITTLCRQLATALPDTKHDICSALSKEDICSQWMKNQWKKLILQPLRSLERQIFFPLTLVIVIDALDECDAKSFKSFMACFDEPWDLSTIQLKFFITSRPEAHIFSAFRAMKSPCKILDDDLEKVPFISDPGKPDDITRFVTLKLEAACKSRNFPDGWPGSERIKKLASNTDGLWIFAATTCRFFEGDRLTMDRAERRLEVVLNNTLTDGTPQSNLDAMYRRILHYSLLGDLEGYELDLVISPYKRIVGSLVVLLDPLPKAALGELLSLSDFQLDNTLQGLYSVLSIEKGQSSPVKFLHLSFREFLLDPKRCLDENLQINARAAHKGVLEACLQVLSSNLKENYFGIPHPSEGSGDIDCSQAPLAVQYASLYWVDHLKHSAFECNEEGEVYQFLKSHFLYWIEFLSVTQKMPEAVSAVLKLNEIFLSSAVERTDFQDFLWDAKRFILHFRGIIETAPLQIYRSALVYSPESSVIRKQFLGHIPKSYTTLPEVDSEWTNSIQRFEDSSDSEEIAFSPDGKLIASSSGRVWDVATGTLLHDFHHSDRGRAVAFSGDGKHVLSLSIVGDLLIWDLEKDTLHIKLKSSLGGADCKFHIFSNARALASCASKQEVEMFDVIKGETLGVVDETDSEISALAFSTDDSLLVSGSEDGTIRIWNIQTQLIRKLEAHKLKLQWCSRVALSRDNKVVAVLAIGRLFIIDLATDTLLRRFDAGHGIEGQMLFLPDSKTLLFAGSEIKIFDVSSEKPLIEIAAKCTVMGVSSDSRLLLSQARWRMLDENSSPSTLIPGAGVHLWDIATGTLLGIFGNNMPEWSQAVFSPDSSMFAIVLEGGTIQLWNLTVPLKPNSQTLEECDHLTSSKRIVISPEPTGAAFNMFKEVHLWNAKTRRLRAVVERSYKLWFYMPSSLSETYESYVGWCGSSDPSTNMMRMQTGSYDRLKLFSGHGKFLLTYDLNQAELWDTESGGLVWHTSHHFESDGEWAFSPDCNLLSHIYKVRSRDGDSLRGLNADKVPRDLWKNVIAIDSDCPDEPPIITIWELQTHTVLHTTKGFDAAFLTLKFSPDSTMFACIRKDVGLHSEIESTVLEIWETASFRCIAQSTPVDVVSPLVWSPNGGTIGCFSSEKDFQLFDTSSLKLQMSLDHFVDHLSDVPEWELSNLAFSPDGSMLTSVHFDNSYPFSSLLTIMIWELGYQKLVGTFDIPALYERHSSLSFSEDGKAIYTDMGRISIKNLSSGLKSQEDLFVKDCWIFYGENEAVWLPHEYRVSRAGTAGNTLIMSYRCCNVAFFGFDEDM